MKNTPFAKLHIDAGAKMHEFAGYNLPVEYTGIKDEHFAVRNSVGVFDVSHMGEIWVKGSKTMAFLQKVTTNNVSKLLPGQAQYSCFPNTTGGIVDDLLVYCFNNEKYLLVVNASNIEKDFAWLNSHNTEGAIIENVSDSIAQLAVQGPNAIKTLQKITDADLHQMKYYTFDTFTVAGIENVIVSATGYTGAGGFELYFDSKHSQKMWDALFEAGHEFDIKPAGLGARDTLRLEMGFCLYGNDIDDNTSPLEAGLGWITKFTDKKEFIGKDIMLRLKQEGISKRLRGFKMIDKGIPRKGYEIVDHVGNKIGDVTSGSLSPVLGIGVGMGYVQTGSEAIGSEIFIQIRNKQLKAEIVKTPFI